MGVQAHITFAVVDYQEQTRSAQPVRIDHSTVIHGGDRGARRRLQTHPLPAHPAPIARATEAPGEVAIHRPGQRAARCAERLDGGVGAELRQGRFDLLKQSLQLLPVAASIVECPGLGTQFVLDARQQRAALAALVAQLRLPAGQGLLAPLQRIALRREACGQLGQFRPGRAVDLDRLAARAQNIAVKGQRARQLAGGVLAQQRAQGMLSPADIGAADFAAQDHLLGVRDALQGLLSPAQSRQLRLRGGDFTSRGSQRCGALGEALLRGAQLAVQLAAALLAGVLLASHAADLGLQALYLGAGGPRVAVLRRCAQGEAGQGRAQQRCYKSVAPARHGRGHRALYPSPLTSL